MSVAVDGLYIFDEHNNVVLEHLYRSRPPSASNVIAYLKSQAHPVPPVLRITDASPPTTLFSVIHSNLLVLCSCGNEIDSLAVFEFLYRVIDAFEEFLGSPLLANRVEENFEVVAQLLNELCDNGIICNTETNSLRESVEVSSIIGKLFTQVGLPGSSPGSIPSNALVSSLKPPSISSANAAIPWRRPNVRHTSNELYVDIIEAISVTLAPSGRPISAVAAGSIAFTAKISGFPDLLLNLSAPGGTSVSKSAGIARTMQLPSFHPCVRLARWKENPGELSFVPPDGRFMLAGYEVDLMPSDLNGDHAPGQRERFFLPATVDLRAGIGSTALDFEARLTLNTNFPGVPQVKNTSNRPGSSNPFSFGIGASGGTSSTPVLEAVIVTIPFPPLVRSITELKASRGDANFNIWNRTVEWKVPTKDGLPVFGIASLSGSILGPITTENASSEDVNGNDRMIMTGLVGYYDEDSPGAKQHYHVSPNGVSAEAEPDLSAKRASRALMPRSASVSFTVRGWLPSGIKVESLMVDVKKSKGLGEGVKPYKGVKYITVSKRGVERRI